MKDLNQLAREAAEKIVTESDEVGQMWLKPIESTILHALETAVGEKDDWLDLMCDEFQRIQSCPGVTSEISDLCERAKTRIKQNVPVIQQRDTAIKAKATLADLLEVKIG